jgi:hypothetical protein
MVNADISSACFIALRNDEIVERKMNIVRNAAPAGRAPRAMIANRTALALGLSSLGALALGIAIGLALVTWFARPAQAAEQPGGFDGLYAGSVAVTSVRAVPCEAKDFTPSITIADGVAALTYLPDSAGKSVVLKAPVSKGGNFAGEGKGEFQINMSGTVNRERIVAKAWAWNCEYALTMQRTEKTGVVAAAASAPK